MTSIFSLTVRGRLALLFVVTALGIGAVTALSLYTLRQVSATLAEVVHQDFEALRNLGDLRASVGNLRRYEKDMFLNMGEEKDLDRYQALWQKELAGTSAVLARLAPIVEGPEQKAVAQLQEGLQGYGKGVESIVTGVKTGKLHDPWQANQAMEPFKAHVRAADKALADIATAIAASVARQEQTLQSVERKASLAALLAGVVILGSAGVLAWRLSRHVVRSLSEAGEAMGRIARGDLSVPTPPAGADEVGALLEEVSRMQAALVAIVTRMREGIESIATASAEVAQGSLDLSERTERQAGRLQETASNMQQMTGAIQTSASNAREANELSLQTTQTARRGGNVVGQVVATMEEITASSRRIAEITSVIDGIAFQTNILALNAAVEAARAGEQGRGFAVVAGEVRSLAQRSATAARDIKSLISTSVEKIESGRSLVALSGQSMQEIVDQVERVTELITSVTAATQEQSSGIGQVNQAVAQIDDMTQQNAALVEQSASAAASLKAQAAQLAETVAVFRL